MTTSPSTCSALLRDPAFVRLLTARTLSMLAISFAPVALAFGVLELPGATATTLSLVIAAEAIAAVLFTLLGGVVADRYSRSTVLQLAEWANAAVHLAMAAMFLTGHAPIAGLMAMAAVAGIASAVAWPALTGIIPEVVPAPVLQEGNAVLGLGGNMARVAGLVAGGIVVVAIGAGWALACAGVAFAIAGYLVARLRLPRRTIDLDAPKTTIWAELRAGWGEFVSHTWLWVVVLEFSVLVMMWQAAHLVLGPVVAKNELGGAATWTMALTAESIGLIVGGLTALRWRPSRPILAVALLSYVAAPPYLLLGMSAPLPAILVAMFGIGFGFELLVILWQTTLQREVPPEALSRVSSYDALGSLVLGPLGLVLAGPAADHFGVHPVLIFCGIVIAVAATAALCVPAVRNLRSGTSAPFVGTDVP